MHATCENYLYGCTLLNLHGLYYTTHGGFWEWAPPCYHFRMPYWDHMGHFFRYFERLSYVLSQGVHRCDVAVMYPVSPLQAGLGGDEAVRTAFDVGTRLFESGRDFVFMDFQSLARAEIRDGRLHVAGASYRALVLPAMRAVRWSTVEQALRLRRAGGIVAAVGAHPEASDRAGGNDPVLDAAVEELFGAPKGTGRRYEGGFTGRWVWSSEGGVRRSKTWEPSTSTCRWIAGRRWPGVERCLTRLRVAPFLPTFQALRRWSRHWHPSSVHGAAQRN